MRPKILFKKKMPKLTQQNILLKQQPFSIIFATMKNFLAMTVHRALLFSVSFLFGQFASAQCPPGFNEIKLELKTDFYYYEVNWKISDQASGQVLFAGYAPNDSFNTYTFCVPDDGCKVFKIIDDANDGMTPDGYYRLYFNGELIRENIGGDFQAGETLVLGCPPGTSCYSALPIDTGAWATPNGMQTWYLFVPQDTGLYHINTCDSLNACGSKIWLYQTCFGLLISDNLTGADYYADGGCENGALAAVALAGGNEYFIRIRSEPADCDTSPIHFTLSYQGPIKGCLDPIACNYNPLATLIDTCLYNGDPNCPTAPDLVTREDEFRASMELGTLNSPDACAVEEGCLRGIGERHVIRFHTYIFNTGDQDYYVGERPSDPDEASSQFVWDPCHGHWHYMGYAEYILFDASGYRLPIGSKTGFCVLDLICPPEKRKYNCVNMGITAGCGDVYDSSLPCQWIDITGIPPGDYTAVMRVNWDRSPDRLGRVEKNYDNNWAQACFNLSYSGNTPVVSYHNDQCPPYKDCTGETYGSAQPDCNGICNGAALHGDFNQDTLQQQNDTKAYLSTIVAGTGDASPCLDLDASGSLNVYDAALLQECVLHRNEPQYWIQEFPCQFPAGFDNTADLVTMRAGNLDTLAKTFDIEIFNPFNAVFGYEFSITGLAIDSVTNLVAAYNPDLRFNAATGKIVGLGLDESAVNKHALPTSFLRVHYSAITATEICLSEITAVVNPKYQRSNASIGVPSCVPGKTSPTNNPAQNAFGVYVQPNPFVERTSIYFENEAAEPVRVELKDVTGKLLRSFEGIRGTSVTIERNNLPQGTYFFTVSGRQGSISGKVVAR